MTVHVPDRLHPRALADQALQAFNTPPELVPEAFRNIAEDYCVAKLRSLSVGDVLRVGETWLTFRDHELNRAEADAAHRARAAQRPS